MNRATFVNDTFYIPIKFMVFIIPGSLVVKKAVFCPGVLG